MSTRVAVCPSVCVSVCVGHTVSCAKTAEPIEMPFLGKRWDGVADSRGIMQSCI